jgi:predicted metalloprotease
MSPSRSAPANSVPVNDDAATFVSVVVADTEDVWTKLFSQAGQKYQAPKLVLFSDAVRSACGLASAASGPFYCPADRQVYLDLSFFSQLRKLGGSGDFAAAYVIAHEVGHHVQTLVGTSNKVRSMQARASKTQSNAIQVKMELQADCLAGLWAHHAQRDRKVLEEGDIEEGLSAASAVGDDHIMKSAGRRVHPESFTHGSSEQRMHWFLRGYKVGEYDACDTFAS